MTEIGSRQDLDEAMEAFKDNPNMHNQSALERAMRVYQCNKTAVEPVERRVSSTHPHLREELERRLGRS